MEIYIYGTCREVLLAKTLLQRAFPYVVEAQPVFDLPVVPGREYCRISARESKKGEL